MHGQLEVLLPLQLAKSFFSPNQDQPMVKFWYHQHWYIQLWELLTNFQVALVFQWSSEVNIKNVLKLFTTCLQGVLRVGRTWQRRNISWNWCFTSACRFLFSIPKSRLKGICTILIRIVLVASHLFGWKFTGSVNTRGHLHRIPSPNLRQTEPKSSGSFAPASVGLSLGTRDSRWEPVLAFFGEDDSPLSGLSSLCLIRAKFGILSSELFSQTASSWTEPVGSSSKLTLSDSEYSELDISSKTWKTLSDQIRGDR